MTSKSNKTEYNRQYYLQNKEKLNQRRLRNYHKNKHLKILHNQNKDCKSSNNKETIPEITVNIK